MLVGYWHLKLDPGKPLFCPLVRLCMYHAGVPPAQYSLAVLAVQQPTVCVDLTLQPGPHVQQHLVLLVLPLQVTPDLRQL